MPSFQDVERWRLSWGNTDMWWTKNLPSSRLTYFRMTSPTLRSSDQSVSSSSRSLWWVDTDTDTQTQVEHKLLPHPKTQRSTVCQYQPWSWCEPRRCLGCCQRWSWSPPGPGWVHPPDPLFQGGAWKAEAGVEIKIFFWLKSWKAARY